MKPSPMSDSFTANSYLRVGRPADAHLLCREGNPGIAPLGPQEHAPVGLQQPATTSSARLFGALGYSAAVPTRRKRRQLNNLSFRALCRLGWGDGADATNMFSWEEISSFGSLRERDRFLTWMRDQIANGLAEEVIAPAAGPFGTADRWFRHIPTGTLWRLVPAENPYGPGFWAVRDQAA
jgi:hypothetical protein